MQQLEKYLFNRSFDDASIAEAKKAAEAADVESVEGNEPDEEIITYTEEQLDAARREGFDAGKEEGVRESGDAMETRISDTLTKLDAEFQNLFQGQTVANAGFFDDAINIAIAVSRKCFPHLSETEAPRVIENMVRDALAEILEEPRVLIHVHPDLVEALNARIGEVAAAANFEGQILIIDDETMASGDCRVTWSSGSAERDMGALWQHIDEIVEHNLHAVKLGLETPETESTDDIDVSDATHDDIMTTAEPSAPTPASTAENEIASDDEAASVSPSPPDMADIEEEYSLDINELDEHNAISSDEDQPITDAIDTPLSTDLPDDPPDTTEIHLQAGPGNVEEPSDEAILGPEKSSDEAEDEKTEDPPSAGSD